MKIHIVQPDDTLEEIVQKYNIPMERLLEANPGFSNHSSLIAGMKMKIPTGKIALTPKKSELENYLLEDPLVEPKEEPEVIYPIKQDWPLEFPSSIPESSDLAPVHRTEEDFEPVYDPTPHSERCGSETPLMPPMRYGFFPIYPFPFYPMSVPDHVSSSMEVESSSVEYG